MSIEYTVRGVKVEFEPKLGKATYSRQGSEDVVRYGFRDITHAIMYIPLELDSVEAF